MRARVFVTLKPSVFDPQGKTIADALHSLGYGGVEDVRQGKYFELDLATQEAAQAKKLAAEVADKLLANPVIALKNLRQMEEFGWSGRYGFYEAVDYHGRGGEVIRTWMAHHEAMSLLAICNLLYDNPMQRYFHAEPQVLATERLLHERLPALAAAEAEPEWTPVAAPAQ